MRFLLRPRNRRWTLLVGLVLVVMVWSLLPSTKRSIFGDTKRSLFEVEGIQCPRSPAPHDGLGVKRRLPQALVIGAMKSGTGNVDPSINPSICPSIHASYHPSIHSPPAHLSIFPVSHQSTHRLFYHPLSIPLKAKGRQFGNFVSHWWHRKLS